MAMSPNSSLTPPNEGPQRTTIDPAEVEKFSQIAQEWWDPFGKFKPLHKFNPVRLAYIRDEICTHFGRERRDKRPLDGLDLIDIGCGGGLVSEPMRRLGATVTAIDASENNIKTAMTHAMDVGLEIDYRVTTAEDLASATPDTFDVVLNLEAIEHVADMELFLRSSATLLKPGGIMIVATINRTLKALALAKVGAEYILRWLPRGTHDPRKFVKPEELSDGLKAAGLDIKGTVGVSYNPFMDIWRTSQDTDVNYMLVATKP